MYLTDGVNLELVICGMVSCTLFAFYSVILAFYPHLRQHPYSILWWTIFCNCVYSLYFVVYGFSSLQGHDDIVTDMRDCQFQKYFLGFWYMAALLWNSCVCFEMVRLSRNAFIRAKWSLLSYHLFCWIFSLVGAVLINDRAECSEALESEIYIYTTDPPTFGLTFPFALVVLGILSLFFTKRRLTLRIKAAQDANRKLFLPELDARKLNVIWIIYMLQVVIWTVSWIFVAVDCLLDKENDFQYWAAFFYTSQGALNVVVILCGQSNTRTVLFHLLSCQVEPLELDSDKNEFSPSTITDIFREADTLELIIAVRHFFVTEIESHNALMGQTVRKANRKALHFADKVRRGEAHASKSRFMAGLVGSKKGNFPELDCMSFSSTSSEETNFSDAFDLFSEGSTDSSSSPIEEAINNISEQLRQLNKTMTEDELALQSRNFSHLSKREQSAVEKYLSHAQAYLTLQQAKRNLATNSNENNSTNPAGGENDENNTESAKKAKQDAAMAVRRTIRARILEYQLLRKRHLRHLKIRAKSERSVTLEHRNAKFSIMCPATFAYLRTLWAVDLQQIVRGLDPKHISVKATGANSGAFFMVSEDKSFIIKTVAEVEVSGLNQLLWQYAKHLTRYPNSFLCHLYGVFRFKNALGGCFWVLLMKCLTVPHPIAEWYDLKGIISRKILEMFERRQRKIAQKVEARKKDLEKRAKHSQSTGDIQQNNPSVPIGTAEDLEPDFADTSGNFLSDVGTLDETLKCEEELEMVAKTLISLSPMKDTNACRNEDEFILRRKDRGIMLDNLVRDIVLDQLALDHALLARCNITDYSLLVAISEPIQGVPENEWNKQIIQEHQRRSKMMGKSNEVKKETKTRLPERKKRTRISTDAGREEDAISHLERRNQERQRRLKMIKKRRNRKGQNRQSRQMADINPVDSAAALRQAETAKLLSKVSSEPRQSNIEDFSSHVRTTLVDQLSTSNTPGLTPIVQEAFFARNKESSSLYPAGSGQFNLLSTHKFTPLPSLRPLLSSTGHGHSSPEPSQSDQRPNTLYDENVLRGKSPEIQLTRANSPVTDRPLSPSLSRRSQSELDESDKEIWATLTRKEEQGKLINFRDVDGGHRCMRISIIDFLIPFGVAKKMELMWKSPIEGHQRVHVLPPSKYASRQFRFASSHLFPKSDLRNIIKLEIQVLEARNLMRSDIVDGNPDPYVTIDLCNCDEYVMQTFQTKHIDDTANPIWDAKEATFVEEHPGTTCFLDHLNFEVWDHDRFLADDLLGRLEMVVEHTGRKEFRMEMDQGELHVAITVTRAPGTTEQKRASVVSMSMLPVVHEADDGVETGNDANNHPIEMITVPQ